MYYEFADQPIVPYEAISMGLAFFLLLGLLINALIKLYIEDRRAKARLERVLAERLRASRSTGGGWMRD